MEVFFVRHGETDGNVAKRHQIEITKLTPKGKQQAKEVAQKIVDLKPTHFITSTHVRTVETASIISSEINIIPQTSRLFTELHRPKNLYGHRHSSPRSILFVAGWYLGKAGGLLGSDEGESYESLRNRIALAKKYLEELPDDARVVVVSHAVFISMFLAHVCNDKPLTFKQALEYWTKLKTLKNADIKHVSVSKVVDGCGWMLNE